jgi:hypothetical protein
LLFSPCGVRIPAAETDFPGLDPAPSPSTKKVSRRAAFNAPCGSLNARIGRRYPGQSGAPAAPDRRQSSPGKARPRMKIIAYDNFKPGITLDDLRPYLKDEVSNVWRLWKSGIVRENYARADVGGVIIVFELDSVDEARRYTDDFPLSKAGLLEWHFLAFDAPLPLEYLFDSSVDVATPWDRTTA